MVFESTKHWAKAVRPSVNHTNRFKTKVSHFRVKKIRHSKTNGKEKFKECPVFICELSKSYFKKFNDVFFTAERESSQYIQNKQITSWLVRFYEFYSLVAKNH